MGTSVECYRDYYYSKRRTMNMVWTPKVAPKWWIERKSGKPMAKKRPAGVKKRPAGFTSSAKKRPAGIVAGDGGKEKKALDPTTIVGEIEAGKTLSLPLIVQTTS